MNYRMISHTLGWVLSIEALLMLPSLVCSFIYSDGCSLSFIITMIFCLAFGMLLLAFKPKTKTMYAKEGFITVALSWMMLSIFGALPFVFSQSIPNYIDALFETVSGFTTTGSSILNNVETLSKSMLFWRSFTHWIGGMGVLVFLVALLPLSGGNNLHLIKAESPGPSVSKIVPKIRSMAKILYGIYIIITLIQVILLLLGGMNLFEALTTAFGTAGTGGFATKSSSLEGYSSYIQNTVTVFMIIFSIDFSVYYLLFRFKIKDALRSTEVKTYIGIIAVSIALITINICSTDKSLFSSVGETIKHSAFQVASIISTTGFSTADFNKWPEFSKLILVVLMIIGACAGSTGGGLKVSRVIILLKSLIKEIKISAHPKSTHKLSMNGRIIPHETVRSVNTFFVAYVATFIISLLIISTNELDFTTNVTAVAATLNNIGPGLSLVGPMGNFDCFNWVSKLVLIFDMLIGRLEIFPILILFSPYTWKK